MLSDAAPSLNTPGIFAVPQVEIEDLYFSRPDNFLRSDGVFYAGPTIAGQLQVSDVLDG